MDFSNAPRYLGIDFSKAEEDIIASNEDVVRWYNKVVTPTQK